VGVHYPYEGDLMINQFIYVFGKLCLGYGLNLKSNNCEEAQRGYYKNGNIGGLKV
jgi:hypothetical protein